MQKINTASLQYGVPLDPDTQHWVYNGLDCCVTLEIVDTLLAQLDDISARTYQFSLDLQGPILEMSMRGFLVDQAVKEDILSETHSDMKLLGEQLDEIIVHGIGLKLNWRSPLQLKKLFYDVLGLPSVKKRNANGIFAPTVNREAIEKLEQYLIAEPICIRLLLLRDLDKRRQFLTTGIDPDGRVTECL